MHWERKQHVPNPPSWHSKEDSQSSACNQLPNFHSQGPSQILLAPARIVPAPQLEPVSFSAAGLTACEKSEKQ